ncbi:hypothetical protein MFIFM68171_00350 [Madurella fahalii]|uniref:Uncharacterized protein n=1 Tax=Madurella fahalii TaxID=1157608 RepID=A0ABQ0FXT2_9PEZI
MTAPNAWPACHGRPHSDAQPRDPMAPSATKCPSSHRPQQPDSSCVGTPLDRCQARLPIGTQTAGCARLPLHPHPAGSPPAIDF